ncbi:MAG: hypothetical protein ACD_63C00234G0003, partial [uncultured bacterium]
LAVALDWLLIPRYTYIGASWATVATEALIAVLGIWMVAKTSGKFPSLRNFWKILIAAIAMALVQFVGAWKIFTNPNWWQLILLLIVGVLIYVLVLYIVGGIKKEDLREILLRR